MAPRSKTSIALSPDLFETVERESERQHKTRSAVIEEALRLWQRVRLEQALAEGYRAMSEENRKTAEGHLSLFKKDILHD
jgi:predicted transcriptional regulator